MKENVLINTALNALKEELPIDWKWDHLKTWGSIMNKRLFTIF